MLSSLARRALPLLPMFDGILPNELLHKVQVPSKGITYSKLSNDVTVGIKFSIKPNERPYAYHHSKTSV